MQGLALIDTRCSITSIDDAVAKTLGLETISATIVQTAGGTRRAIQYLAHAEIAGAVSDLWTMTGASLAAGGIFALVGTDFLSNCSLVYDGPAGRFSLAL